MILKSNYLTKVKKLFIFIWLFIVATIPSFIALIIYSNLNWLVCLNFIESVLFSLIIIALISCFKSSRFKQFIYYFLFSFFVFCNYVEAVYFVIYGTYFSPSSLFLFFDSNPQEAIEFLTFYFTPPLLIFTSITLVVFFVCFRKLFLICRQLPTFRGRHLFYNLILILMILGFMRISKIIDYNFPYLFGRSFVIYENQLDQFEVYKNNKNGNFKNIKKTYTSDKELFVLVLGESTTKSHLGIYGYNRQTTPQLLSKKDELILFKDVISPHTYSIGAVVKLLTLANYEDPNPTNKGSIIQLANAVGFETHWLSNQRPIGSGNNLITRLSASVDHSKFLTSVIERNSTTLDESLLKDLNLVLEESKSEKIFIVLHLIGTHHNYQERYPASFNVFSGDVNSNFKSKESINKINHYDNAVLYNDFVVNSIIDLVKSTNTNSFILYLSDHGEELYKDRNMAGHNQDNPTQSMYEVPFLLWQSPKYKNHRSIDIDANRRYMTDDLFHSLADLMGVQSDCVNYQRSIFSNTYEERTRIILDSIDYDTSFKSIE